MSDPVFIGVDGGGTGCRAVIGTRSAILGTGRGGPANVSSDMASAIKNARIAIDQAMAGLGDLDMTNACAHMGLAGVLTATQADAVATQMPIGQVVVTDDRPTMLTGALGDDDGIVAAIGTGSFLGSKRGDAYRFVGGWGLDLSDEASGAWLGRAALTETLHACDGMRNHTGLTRQFMDHFGNDPDALVVFAATARPADFGTLAPKVSIAAANGDPAALPLMQRGTAYIEAALRTLGFQSNDTLCLAGGLGPIYAPFLASEFTANLRPVNGSALDGALMLARRMA